MDNIDRALAAANNVITHYAPLPDAKQKDIKADAWFFSKLGLGVKDIEKRLVEAYFTPDD